MAVLKTRSQLRFASQCNSRAFSSASELDNTCEDHHPRGIQRISPNLVYEFLVSYGSQGKAARAGRRGEDPLLRNPNGLDLSAPR